MRQLYKFIAPLLLLLSAIAVVAFILAEASDEQDRQSDQLYRSFVTTSINHERHMLGKLVMDYAWWDEAIDNLLRKPDLVWADENIGSYLHDNYDIDISLVVSGNDTITLGFVAGKLDSDLHHFATSTGLMHLVDQARQAPLSSSTPASGLIKIDQKLYIASVAAFTPEKTVLVSRQGLYRSVLVVLEQLDPAFISRHGQAFQLQIGALDMSATEPGVPLLSATGQLLATLSYEAPQPGASLLQRIFAPLVGLLLIILILGALSAWIIMRVAALNRQIEAEKNASQQARHELQQANEQMEVMVEQRTADLREEIVQRNRAEQELLRTEQRFQTLTEEATVAILVHRNNQPLYANPALLSLYKMDSFAQIQALDSTLLLWAEQEREHVMKCHHARLNHRPAPKEYTLSSNPEFGPQRQFFNRSFRIDWDRESAVCTLLLDITESIQTQQQLQEARDQLEARVKERTKALEATNQALADEVIQHQQAQQQLRLSHEVLQSTSEAVVVTDTHGIIQEVNAAYCQLTGYRADEVLGKNPRTHKSDRHDADFYRDMWAALTEQGHWRGEIWDQRKNGEVYPKWLSISAVRNDQGVTTHYVGVFSDITERKDQEARLEQMALYDSLTTLPNRLLFKEHVTQKLLKARRQPDNKIALLFIDLDHFKHVNDSLGHAAGDRLLVEVAQRISQSLRGSDSIGRVTSNPRDASSMVARMGGDEFTVAIDGLQDNEAIALIIERLRTTLDLPVLLGQQEVFVSASIGVSVFPDDGANYEELVKNADMAMYRSKNAGRNQFTFFSPALDNIASRRIELEAGLRRALHEGGFILHYQPKICAASGSIDGMEALVRWQHPDKGLIPPGDFIQVAEDTGLIVPMGEWIIATACRQVQIWNQTQHTSLKLAVNLSARQFSDPALLDKILAILQTSGFPPEQLELEVTESSIISNIETAIQTLNQLRAAGISVAIDDFGTGYSSLSYLRKLPLDTLKIDRSFISSITTDKKVAAIVKTIIDMGQNLQLAIVAEGVETAEQSALLNRYNCPCQQGFLFSRPLDTDTMTRFITQTQAGAGQLLSPEQQQALQRSKKTPGPH